MNEPDTVEEVATATTDNLLAHSSSSVSTNGNSQSPDGSQVLLHKMREMELSQPVEATENMENSAKNGHTHGTGIKEYFCGVGKCRPKWMQVFRDSKFFTFILCLNCCIEGALVSGGWPASYSLLFGLVPAS